MRKVLTVILSGWGYREEEYGNAIKMADPEVFNTLWKTYPHTTLHADGEYVGLNPNKTGNSEVGHLILGAGRKITQHGPKITEFLKSNYENNPAFVDMLDEAKQKDIHIIGMFSDGGVHSDLNHFLSIYSILKNNNAKKIHFHLITDGKDTKSNAAINFINELDEIIKNDTNTDISSICGRYYAMDKDGNYDKTKIFYDLITKGIGIKAKTATDGILNLYKKNQTDEFLYPTIVHPESIIKDNDIILWMNYRNDRSFQILEALTNPEFQEFPTYKYQNLNIYSFFPIRKDIKTINILEETPINNTLGIYLSTLGLTEARIADSKKFYAITYFFDGMQNIKLEKCSQIQIPSPDIEEYKLNPEINTAEVTKKAINAMEKDTDFILLNYANPDIIAHTGNIEATMKAITAVDVCLKRLYEVAKDNFYTMIILSDHGNADIMLDEFNNPIKSNTNSEVPFIITDPNIHLKKHGDLTNVAPTILEYMDIALPDEMVNTDSLLLTLILNLLSVKLLL